MPELPEVEVVVLGLGRLLPGHRVLKVEHDWPKGFPNATQEVEEFVVGAHIQSVQRRAKTILIGLDTGYTLAVHLKMTGQLVYVRKSSNAEQLFGAGHPTDSLLGDLPDKTTRVTLELDNHSKLFFNDVRKFGWVRLLPTATLGEVDFLRKLGPDALAIDSDQFVQIISPRKKSIKACLLDQTLIAGCGNIYADESLWMSRLHPATAAHRLPPQQLANLHKNLTQVMRLSIDKGGSSSKNYINAEGKKGSYLEFANVYQRTGQPCSRCGSPIDRLVVAGRGTHICSTCQQVEQP